MDRRYENKCGSILFWGVLLTLVHVGCQTTNYAQKGTALGGVTGAGVGALIGEAAADRPLVGAAIGSAVGALSGAAVGSGLDRVEAKHDQRVRQVAYQSETLLDEVVSMSQAELSDDIIERHVRSQGLPLRLGAYDLIRLRQQGVSDRVIATLQSAPLDTELLVPPTPSTVVVEEHVVVPPPPIWIPPRPYYHYRGHPFRCQPPGFHWGVAFGH